MDVQDMRIFARVAALQNLSAVGSELGLTPGTISKRLQALEDDLGAKLFERNTRSIRITEEGQKLLEYVERILIDIEGARSVVGASAELPRGTLRIVTAMNLGGSCIVPAICAFMEENKEVDILVDVTERPVNLHENGYDVAICTGLPHNPGLKRKILAADPQALVASPAYLKARGTPSTPDSLAEHSCLVLGENSQWEFMRKDVKYSLRVAGRLKSDSTEALLYAARSGLGIAKVSRSRVAQDLKHGYLHSVLDAFEASHDTAICAVYPGSKHMLPKLRVFLDFLGEWFRGNRMPLANGQSRGPLEMMELVPGRTKSSMLR